MKAAFDGKLTADWRETHKGELEPVSMLQQKIKAERVKSGKYKAPPPIDTSDLAELPVVWVWTTVAEIGQVISGSTPKGRTSDSFTTSMCKARTTAASERTKTKPRT